MTPLRRRLPAIPLVLFSLATASLGAGPVILFDAEASAVRLVRKADVDSGSSKQFVVTAQGAKAVSQAYGNVSGVLLQAVAQPDAALRSLPIDLSYRLKGDHDAVLRVIIGDSEVVSDVPAWVWAVAAQFADHDATAAITMSDDPQTPSEKRFRQRWLASTNSPHRLLWVRYHPAVDDTMVGFFLFAADAMLADADRVRTITDGLKGFDQYCGYAVTMDPAKSRRAAHTLDGLIALEFQPGVHVMLNDVSDGFNLTIANAGLRIAGSPSYHFARRTGANQFTEVLELTEMLRKNRSLVLDANPLLYAVVADFAKLVAFFNFVDRSDPNALDEFVRRLKPVLDRIPTTETPLAIVVRAR